MTFPLSYNRHLSLGHYVIPVVVSIQCINNGYFSGVTVDDVQVAFNVERQEDIHDTTELVAKLLTSRAILHACCTHEEDEIRKRDDEIKQLQELLSRQVTPRDEINTSAEHFVEPLHHVTSSTAPLSSSPQQHSGSEGQSRIAASHSQQVKPVTPKSTNPEEILPLTTMAVLISIGVVIGAVIVGYYF